MKKWILIILILLSPSITSAQSTYITGKILNVENRVIETQSVKEINIEVIKGEEKGEVQNIRYPIDEFESLPKTYEVGSTIVIEKTVNGDTEISIIHDDYRIPMLIGIALFFIFIIVLFGKKHGFRALIGLCFSISVIMMFIVPQILAGKSPLTISIIGSLIIATISLYLSHGFNKRTTIALASTTITFTISAVLAIVFVSLTKLTGLGTEEAAFLVGDATKNINLQGLLLGGIIIGTLGVLDDITTSQSAAIEEIHKANPSLSFQQLYTHGISIGKEHIASLVNTLALAYAGAALPLFLLFAINDSTPLWVIINSEFISEEIIRTIVGSISLILAVPITTILASYYAKK